MAVENIELPVQIKRQYPASLEADKVFATTFELNQYLSNPLRYAGMVVSCLANQESLFILNNARTAWYELTNASKSTVIDLSGESWNIVTQLTKEGNYVIIDSDDSYDKPVSFPNVAQGSWNAYTCELVGSTWKTLKMHLVSSSRNWTWDLNDNVISEITTGGGGSATVDADSINNVFNTDYATATTIADTDKIIGVGKKKWAFSTIFNKIVDGISMLFLKAGTLSVVNITELDGTDAKYFTVGKYGLYISDGWNGQNNMNLEISYASHDGTGGDGDQDYMHIIRFQTGEEYTRFYQHLNNGSNLGVWSAWKLTQTGSGSSSATDISYTNPTYPTVAAALDKLLYVAPSITSFTGGTTVEIGSSVTPVLNWSYNKTMTEQRLNGAIELIANRSKTMGAITSDTTYSLWATDGTNQINGSQSVLFRFYKFWGTGATPTGADSTARRAAIIAKNPTFQAISAGSFVMTTGSTETNFFVCLPTGLVLSSALDTTANAAVTFDAAVNYIMKDAGGVDRTYKMYTVTLGQAFSSSHNWTITIQQG